MKYSYPAIFEEDAENPEYICVTIPDVEGAITFGFGEENALAMAKDLLREMLVFSSNKCGTPHTLEEALEFYPSKNVVMIDVEI